MAIWTANSPGKVILFGEHAVVYGYPAIAAPVSQVKAHARIETNHEYVPGTIHLNAPDVGIHGNINLLPQTNPIRILVGNLLNYFDYPSLPALTISIHSEIPIAAGMGSGAAISTALIKAFSNLLNQPLTLEEISSLAFEIEEIYHGNPSGIDNTVITYQRPVYFQRGQPFVPIKVSQPVKIIIADTGIKKETARVVAEVRSSWQADSNKFDGIFREIGEVVQQARNCLENGFFESLGLLMNRNQQMLCELGVSSPEIDCLVTTAIQCKALGAKLSGGGHGGNIIVLPGEEDVDCLIKSLEQAGAVRTISTIIDNPME